MAPFATLVVWAYDRYWWNSTSSDCCLSTVWASRLEPLLWFAVECITLTDCLSWPCICICCCAEVRRLLPPVFYLRSLILHPGTIGLKSKSLPQNSVKRREPSSKLNEREQTIFLSWSESTWIFRNLYWSILTWLSSGYSKYLKSCISIKFTTTFFVWNGFWRLVFRDYCV